MVESVDGSLGMVSRLSRTRPAWIGIESTVSRCGPSDLSSPLLSPLAAGGPAVGDGLRLPGRDGGRDRVLVGVRLPRLENQLLAFGALAGDVFVVELGEELGHPGGVGGGRGLRQELGQIVPQVLAGWRSDP